MAVATKLFITPKTVCISYFATVNTPEVSSSCPSYQQRSHLTAEKAAKVTTHGCVSFQAVSRILPVSAVQQQISSASGRAAQLCLKFGRYFQLV